MIMIGTLRSLDIFGERFNSSISKAGVRSPESGGLFNGKRWSLRASEFKKYWIRVKQAIEAFSIGIVLIKVFIGVDKSETRDKAVKADDVSKVRPVYFATMTNTTKVMNGARVVELLAAARQWINLYSDYRVECGVLVLSLGIMAQSVWPVTRRNLDDSYQQKLGYTEALETDLTTLALSLEDLE
jgi:hypothetical protein